MMLLNSKMLDDRMLTSRPANPSLLMSYANRLTVCPVRSQNISELLQIIGFRRSELPEYDCGYA